MNNRQNPNRPLALALSFDHMEDENAAFHAAAQASDRFLCAGSLLGTGEYLDLQVPLHRFLNLTRAVTKSNISADDFAWMFSSCAPSFHYASHMIDLFAENRRVYALIPAGETNVERAAGLQRVSSKKSGSCKAIGSWKWAERIWWANMWDIRR